MTRTLTASLRVGVIALAVLACGGCIDIVQYLSVNKQGEPTVYLRLTLQKGLFAMADSMGGEAPADLEGSLDQQFNLSEEQVLGGFPAGVDVDYQKVNTDLEYGFTLSYTLSRAVESRLAAGSEKPPLVPVRSGDTITILFPQEGSGDEEQGAEGEQMAQLFLSSAKYRVMVSKQLVKSLSSATFATPDGEVSPSVVDLPEIYLVEVPLVHWLTAKGPCTLTLR